MAGHGDFREVIPEILKTQSKVIFLSGTPEIIEGLFPEHNRDEYVLKFDIKRPLKQVKIYSSKYSVKGIISDIITTNSNSDKTILIRVNSKKVIDDIAYKFKLELKG